MEAVSLIPPLLAFLLAPFFLGIINRTKAVLAGRTGQPLAQLYFDIYKLLRKGAVYSQTTSWVFRAGPLVGLAASICVVYLLPFGGIAAPAAFSGDFILMVFLLGLWRFFLVVAALDTGSAFEGMGASREVAFSSLVEPALLLSLAVVAHLTDRLSLSAMLLHLNSHAWVVAGPALGLISAALMVIFLTENARIPIDDPNTHLELTMIHEVMVLDHSGPDFAFIQYSAALKHWIFGALLAGIALPVHTAQVWLNLLISLASMTLIAILTGIVESSMARLRLLRVPQLLIGAIALCALALIVVARMPL